MAPPSDEPSSEGSDSWSKAHPALHPPITSIPVTPGNHDSGRSSYIQTPNPSDHNTEGPRWNANSYSTPIDEEFSSSSSRPDSPTKVAAGARTGAELLRRLSLVNGRRPEVADLDPRAVHPGLNLTGGLISATFCIPHAVEFRGGADWVRSFGLYVGVANLTRILNQGVVLRRSSILSPTYRLPKHLGIILW